MNWGILLGISCCAAISAVDTGIEPVFFTLYEQAELQQVLPKGQERTVFIPSNEAFEAYGEEALNDLKKPENKEKLRQFLLYHIVPKEYTTDDLEADMLLKTYQGAELKIWIDDKGVMVNDAEILLPDIKYEFQDGGSGYLQVIDKVLVAPS